MTRDWWTYVIVNGQDVAYTGCTRDCARRLAQHNEGSGARFTRGRGPWSLAHVEGPFDKGEALRREARIKRDRALKRRIKEAARLGEQRSPQGHEASRNPSPIDSMPARTSR